MRIEVDVEKKYFLILLGVVLLLGIVVYVGAYGTSNPSNFGHTPSEIDPGVFGGTSEDNWRFPGQLGVGVNGPDYEFHIKEDGRSRLAVDTASNTYSPTIFGIRKKGTQVAPASVTAGDNLLLIRAYGRDDVGVKESSRIEFEVGGPVQTDNVPGRIRFFTKDDVPGSSLKQRMRIDSAGLVRIFNDLEVDGLMFTLGWREIDYDGGGGGSSGTYNYGVKSYVFDSTPSSVGVVRALNNSKVNSLCADIDGCLVTIAMINYDGSGLIASREERLFVNGNAWRFSNDISGQNNNGNVQEWKVWDCIFTDAETSTGSNNERADNNGRLGFLNVKGGSHSDSTTTCRVVIRDES
jgi:hypothetical protein